MASDVADVLELDRVLWIPAASPPHKSDEGVSPPGIRLMMVRAVAELDDRFEACTRELDREGPSYTSDTVRALRAEMPEGDLFLILGADQLQVLDTWHEPEEIVRHVRLAVMDRDGESAAEAVEGVVGGASAVVVPVRRVDVSSTEVRERAREGADISGMVPAAVRAIIEQERLYSGS